jgi:hypothetical protein
MLIEFGMWGGNYPFFFFFTRDYEMSMRGEGMSFEMRGVVWF